MNKTFLAVEDNFQIVKTSEIVNADDKQFAHFNNKWFQGKIEDFQRFTDKLKDNETIKKVATNPLLLTLLCLVFEELASVPCDRLQLYKEGLELLLQKWDSKRNIERDQLYKKLSFQRKEDLLSQIALKTFERGNYFFKQKEIEHYIADYICNLPDAQTNPEELQLDSSAVLKSIEAQHGLLVEGEKGIYSFCEPTFHEYFAAKEIINSPNPQALEKALQNLVSHVTETRWREVFLLAVGMLRNADYLSRLMKHQIDALVASNKELQHFLAWINQKYNSSKAPYKPAAFRAFCIESILDFDSDFARTLDENLAYDLGFNLARVHSHTHEVQNFQFSEQQKQALKQYYDANKLLVDCLNKAHYVTRTVREELEETLLVPSEIS